MKKPRIEITLINDELVVVHRDSVIELYNYLNNIGLSKHKNIKKV